MLSKLSLVAVVRDHLETLRDHRTGKYSYSDLAVFLFFPLIVASILIAVGVEITEGVADILLTSMAVFAALLLNLLILVYDIVRKPVGEGKDTRSLLREAVLKQAFSNISFAIAVAVIVIVLLLALLLRPSWSLGEVGGILRTSLNGAVFFLLGVFLLDLLMVLKRVHVLISKELD